MSNAWPAQDAVQLLLRVLLNVVLSLLKHLLAVEALSLELELLWRCIITYA
jgi:hypothetical protein